ncbi:MAG: hypothetical protein IT522_08475, partial [Burkholderiales bacterium]|nr:hypothetical protein [Burkholderiales bacterium]
DTSGKTLATTAHANTTYITDVYGDAARGADALVRETIAANLAAAAGKPAATAARSPAPAGASPATPPHSPPIAGRTARTAL